MYRAAIVFALLAGECLAQTSFGTITGSVMDSSGGAVPDASIVIANVGTGADLSVTTDGARNFAAPSLLPYSGQWNFSLQQQVGAALALEADYVGGVGHKLYTNWRGNGAPAGPGAIDPRRPFPQFGTISEENPRGNNNYNSLQLKAERRYSHGFTMLASYTWAKSIDDSSGLTTLSQNTIRPAPGARPVQV